MKKIIKLITATASFALLGGALAGCGEQAGGGDDGVTKIVFGHCAGDTIEEGLNEYARAFTELVKKN